MEMIRLCQPTTFEDWKTFYFEHAYTKNKQRLKVNDELLRELGERLYEKIKGVVLPEWTRAFAEITVEDCVEYIREVTLHRTYDGFNREKSVVHDNLAKEFPEVRFEESDSDLDHAGQVDYIGWVGDRAFGIQIKPISGVFTSSGQRTSERMKGSIETFKEKYSGTVFLIFSEHEVIKNKEVVDQIRAEIERLGAL